jgi:hypothetical protein
MRNIIILLLLPVAAMAQTIQREAGEQPESFTQRIAPAMAVGFKYMLSDKFNTQTEKLVMAYALFEQGNSLNNQDSSLTFYISILTPTDDKELVYTEQKFRLISSYLKKVRMEQAEVVMSGKEKRLQVYVSEMVRGPGGIPRDVKRTFVYKQEKVNKVFTDTFREVIGDY